MTIMIKGLKLIRYYYSRNAMLFTRKMNFKFSTFAGAMLL